MLPLHIRLNMLCAIGTPCGSGMFANVLPLCFPVIISKDNNLSRQSGLGVRVPSCHNSKFLTSSWSLFIMASIAVRVLTPSSVWSARIHFFNRCLVATLRSELFRDLRLLSFLAEFDNHTLSCIQLKPPDDSNKGAIKIKYDNGQAVATVLKNEKMKGQNE